MRKSFTAAVVLVATLTFTVPATAAPRDGDVPAFTKIVRMLKRAFGVKASAEPIIPVPNQQPSGGGK